MANVETRAFATVPVLHRDQLRETATIRRVEIACRNRVLGMPRKLLPTRSCGATVEVPNLCTGRLGMGNNHHEDERYKNFYDRPPHGEVPTDQRVKKAKEGGKEPVSDSTAKIQEPDSSRS